MPELHFNEETKELLADGLPRRATFITKMHHILEEQKGSLESRPQDIEAFDVTFTEDELVQLTEHAQKAGLTVSQFLRALALGPQNNDPEYKKMQRHKELGFEPLD